MGPLDSHDIEFQVPPIGQAELILQAEQEVGSGVLWSFGRLKHGWSTYPP